MPKTPPAPVRYAMLAVGAVAILAAAILAFIPSIMGDPLDREHRHYVGTWDNDADLFISPGTSKHVREGGTNVCTISYSDGDSENVQTRQGRGPTKYTLLRGEVVHSNDKGEAKVSCSYATTVYSGSATSLLWIPQNSFLVLLGGVLFVAGLPFIWKAGKKKRA